MSKLANNLRGSVRYDAINGDSSERAVCKKQMTDAADLIDDLEAKLHAAEEREAGLRKALEEIQNAADMTYAGPLRALAHASLSAAPEGRVAKLEKVAEAARNLVAIHSFGPQYDELVKAVSALSNLAGES